MSASASPRTNQHVAVIGAGGNIGSHLIPHLARMPEVAQLTLIDPDRYELHNVRNQAIAVSQVGSGKVQVQAAVARRIDPLLSIQTFAQRVEDVPLGLLKADILLACLDSRRSRQRVNEIAWHLGVPWIDAGVLSDGQFARIELFAPAPNAPCLECRWANADYAALEQPYPCSSEAHVAASDAPSGLGALAAALQALECQRYLQQQPHPAALGAGDQIVLSASHHRHLRTQHRRNPECRLADHSPWTIQELSLMKGKRTIGRLFDTIQRRLGPETEFAIGVAGHSFVRKMLCAQCGAAEMVLRLSRHEPESKTMCVRCRRPMIVTGFGVTEWLASTTLTTIDRARPLHAAGLHDRDVITVNTSQERRHFELRLKAHPLAVTVNETPALQESA